MPRKATTDPLVAAGFRFLTAIATDETNVEVPRVFQGPEGPRQLASRRLVDRAWRFLVQGFVRALVVVEVDNPTPIVLSYGNSVTRGIHGSVVPSLYTRCSSNRGTLSVGAASRRSEIVYR